MLYLSGSLYVFSGQTQFALASDGTLSPKNARLDSITEFTSDTDVAPVGAGNSVYFVSKRADYASVQEYRVAQYYTDVKDAEDVTAHVPYYIPNDVYRMVGSSNDNLLFCMSTNDKHIIYVYKYLYMNGNRVQSSWSKWKFKGEVIGADFVGSTMYLAVKYSDNSIYLEKLTLSYNTEDFKDTEKYRVMLDRKKEITLSMDTASEGIQYITVDVGKLYGDKNTDIVVVTSDGIVYEGNQILKDDVTKMGSKVIVGVPYSFEMTLSTIYMKQRDSQGSTVTIPSYKLMLRHVFFDYADTGFMEVDVDNKYKYKLTNKKVGNYKLGNITLLTGTFRVPVRKLNTKAVIKVVNSSPLPLSIIGGGYEANYTARFKNL